MADDDEQRDGDGMAVVCDTKSRHQIRSSPCSVSCISPSGRILFVGSTFFFLVLLSFLRSFCVRPVSRFVPNSMVWNTRRSTKALSSFSKSLRIPLFSRAAKDPSTEGESAALEEIDDDHRHSEDLSLTAPPLTRLLRIVLYGNGVYKTYIQTLVFFELVGVIGGDQNKNHIDIACTLIFFSQTYSSQWLFESGYMIWVMGYACREPICKALNFLIFVAQMMLIIANTIFGYHFCKDNKLQKVDCSNKWQPMIMDLKFL